MSITGTRDLERAIQGGAPIAGTLQITRAVSSFISSVGGFLTLSRRLSTSPETLELVLTGAPSGLVGTLSLSILSFDGSVYAYFPSTDNIAEVPPGTGRYVAAIDRPDIGRYFAIWTNGITTVQTDLFILPDSIVQTPIRVSGFSDYHIKAGDLEPSMLLTLRNAGGDPIDLSGALQVDITATKRGDDTPIVDRPILILDPAEDGQVVLDWQDGETDEAGVYTAECSILWPTNGRSTAPSKAGFRFEIEAATT